MRLGSALAGSLLLAACASAPDEDAPPPDWAAITTELAERVERDQAVRRELVASDPVSIELAERVGQIDAENTARMKELVERHGWPTIARVGAEGEGNAWLLVQHADEDVPFQERCLVLLRGAVAAGEANPKHLAYLADRVDMHRGRPQRYGTQFVPKDGTLEPWKLEDPARVDEWRAEVGLGTLAEYAEILRSQ
jgi:uncharacterized protein DUF6624